MALLRNLFVALAVLLPSAAAYDNGMGRKPPMGWQTWCSVGPCGEDHCTDGQIREMARTLTAKDADSGVSMKDLGYSWIVLDDCWHPSRDKNGSLVPFPRFFPDGMKLTIDYVHSLGLTFGLYTSVGDETCHGGWSPGSLGHFQQDADTFASWGVDYVKIDYCGKGDDPAGHHNMSLAMNATKRQMVLALCRGPYQREQDWGYAPEVAQVWRAEGDHHDEFANTMGEVMSVKGKGSWSSPHNWAYLDMMMTGGQGCHDQCVGSRDDTGVCNFTTPAHCPGMSDAEYRTEASLYTVVSSPLMVGTDIRLMTPIMKELLLNTEAIAIK
jgi:alpha-galactosidase